MHILIIPSWYSTPTNPIRGSFFHDQALALHKAGHQVGMLVPPTKLRSFHGLAEVRAHWRQASSAISIEDDGGVMIYRIPWWGWRASLWPWSRGELALRVFDRYVQAQGKPDILHGHSTLYGGYLAACIGQQRGIPSVLTEHSTNFQDGFILPGQGAITRYTLRHTARRFAVGNGLAAALQRYEPERQVEVVGNVVDVDWFTPPTVPPEAPPFVFLMVASLTRRKGHDILLPAFARAFREQPVMLRIVGSGYSGRKLEQLRDTIRTLGLQDQVELHGLVSREELRQHFQQAHALVSSSYTEGFGVTLIEAMACGKPVIATRSGGPEEFVTDMVGLLVPVGDVAALAAALQQMRRDFDQYDPARIRQFCIDHYSEAAIIARLEAVYADVIGQRTEN